MRRLAELSSAALLLACFICRLQAQDASALDGKTTLVRVVVGATAPTAESVIQIPPDTSWTTSISFAAASRIVPIDASKFAEWLKHGATSNGLSAPDVRPWHVVIAYDQFDGDGDNFNSGVLEEFWAGPKKFKRTYTSDKLNQTDYGTDSGLFRVGDQRWPNRAEL